MTKTYTAFENFLVRSSHGISTRLRALKPLGKKPGYEQLIAALLRRDNSAAKQILMMPHDKHWVDSLLLQVHRDHIAGLLMDRVFELELNSLATELKSRQSNLLEELRMGTILESTQYCRAEEHFRDLLVILDEIQDHICWPKGVALSRFLYPDPRFRVSSDFDLITKPELRETLLDILYSHNFKVILDNHAFCPQLGIGPLRSLDDMFLLPASELVPCEILSFNKKDWPILEIKFDPLDSGLRMKETERFWRDTVLVSNQDLKFRVPSTIDHLLFELRHFHKHGLEGWQWLYDIHLLVLELSDWELLVERAKKESIEVSVWTGLAVLVDRLHSPVPPEILKQLEPSQGQLSKTFALSVNTRFVWNSNSLLILILSAFFAGDRQRKFEVIHDLINPTAAFLSNYYSSGNSPGKLRLLWYKILHFLVLLFPAFITRITLGRWLWKPADQFINPIKEKNNNKYLP